MDNSRILVELKEGKCKGADSQRKESFIRLKAYDDGTRIPICLHFGSTEDPRCNLSESLLCKYHNQGA